MHFCGFCGKGPFSSSSALNKHTRHSVNCNEAAHKKWGHFATNMWKNAPGPSNIEQHPPTLPPFLENEETANIPDMTLEDDLLGLEANVFYGLGQQPDVEPEHENQPVQRDCLHVTVEHGMDNEKESAATYFIEEFSADLGAGAVLGEDIPFFDKILRKQQEDGSSLWGPFEDQEEWDLAKWLIKNVGQKQINAVLNLKIIRSHWHFFDCERLLILLTFDRRRNERCHRFTTAVLF